MRLLGRFTGTYPPQNSTSLFLRNLRRKSSRSLQQAQRELQLYIFSSRLNKLNCLRRESGLSQAELVSETFTVLKELSNKRTIENSFWAKKFDPMYKY